MWHKLYIHSTTDFKCTICRGAASSASAYNAQLVCCAGLSPTLTQFANACSRIRFLGSTTRPCSITMIYLSFLWQLYHYKISNFIMKKLHRDLIHESTNQLIFSGNIETIHVKWNLSRMSHAKTKLQQKSNFWMQNLYLLANEKLVRDKQHCIAATKSSDRCLWEL